MEEMRGREEEGEEERRVQAKDTGNSTMMESVTCDTCEACVWHCVRLEVLNDGFGPYEHPNSREYTEILYCFSGKSLLKSR